VTASAVLAVLTVVVALVLWLVRPDERDSGARAEATPAVSGSTSEVSAAELARVARTRVFFGHQSVGQNVLDGVPAVFTAHGAQAPPIGERRTDAGPQGGFIAHAYIGENEKPLLKIKDFDAQLRAGTGRQVDVAVMKFCYVDIMSDTDVKALFAAYRDAVAALERDFPGVTFIKVTVPLTTDAGALSRLKTRLGGSDRYSRAENVAREQLNALIRREYTGDHLFDLAAIESTRPDGGRVSGQAGEGEYFALYEGYASDQGHLNGEGARRAATAWVKAIAEASTK
jgi:hypothetical protein